MNFSVHATLSQHCFLLLTIGFLFAVGQSVYAQDMQKPTRQAVQPADDSGSVPLDQTFSITFNEPIVAGTGLVYLIRNEVPSTFETFSSGDYTFSDGGMKASFKPRELLIPGDRYYIYIDEEAFQDLDGNKFDGFRNETSWNFIAENKLILQGASLLGTTGLKLIYSDTVLINGPVQISDFKLTDGSNEIISPGPTTLVDGNAKDFELELTVDVDDILGDLKVNFTPTGPMATSVRNTGVPTLQSWGKDSVVLDLDQTIPQIDVDNSRLKRSVATDQDSIILTYNEQVQLGTGSGTFEVKNGAGVTFGVTAVIDGIAKDNEIILLIGATISEVSGGITVTYSGEKVVDFGGNKVAASSFTLNRDLQAPALSNAVRVGNTRINLVFDEKVRMIIGGSSDFIVKDGVGQGINVSSLADDVMGDAVLNLTVGNFGAVSGDLRITYNQNQSNIQDFAGNRLLTDNTGVTLDLDTEAPTLTLAQLDDVNRTSQINLIFDDRVQLGTDLLAIRTDFVVKDRTSQEFIVTNITDQEPFDEVLELTVEDFEDAIGDLTVQYTRTGLSSTNAIYDFGGNALTNFISSLIDIPMIARPKVTRVAANRDVSDDVGDNVAQYRTTSNPSAFTPIQITPNISGSTITIYDDRGLTHEVAKQTMVTGFFSPRISDLINENFADGVDDHGVYTFYITETAIGGQAAEGPPKQYSIAFLDGIHSTVNRSLFASGDQIGTTLQLKNHPQEHTLGLSGSGLVDAVIGPAATPPSTTSSVRFSPVGAGSGSTRISLSLRNDTTGVSVTFDNIFDFKVLSSSSVFSSGQKLNFCESESLQPMELANPADVEIGEETDDMGEVDTALPDFLTLEAYYLSNGTPMSSVSDSSGLLGAGNLIAKVLAYDRSNSAPARAAIMAGSPTFAVNEWEFDPAALDTITQLKNLATRPPVDTLRFSYLVTSDDGVDSVVNSTVDIPIYPEPRVRLLGLSNAICKNDELINLRANIKTYPGDIGNDTTGLIRNGYKLFLKSGNSYSLFMDSTITGSAGAVNSFNPGSGVVNSGSYRIIYESLPTTPAQCVSRDTIDFDLNRVPSQPTISKVISQNGFATNISTQRIFAFCDDDNLDEAAATSADNYPDSLNIVVVAGGGGKFRWYSDPTLTNAIDLIDSNGDSATVLELGARIPAIAATATYDFYVIEENSEGCQTTAANALKISIIVNKRQSAPLLANGIGTVLGDSVLIESCLEAELEDLEMVSSLISSNADSSKFLWYLENPANPGQPQPTAVSGFDPDDLQNSIITGSQTSGSEVVDILQFDKSEVDTLNLWVRQIDFISTTGANFPDVPFLGCQSGLRKISIVTLAKPSDVLAVDPDFSREYFVCSGEEMKGIEVNDDADNVQYNWYTDDDNNVSTLPTSNPFITRSNLRESDLDSRLTAADDIDGTLDVDGRVFSNTTSGIYYYWVSRTIGANDDTGFEGCASEPSSFAITVLPNSSLPGVNGNTSGMDAQLFFCADDLDATDVLVASSNFSAADFDTRILARATDLRTQGQFKWYTSDASGNRGAELGTQDNNGDSITVGELFLIDEEDIVDRYFLLTHESFRIDTNNVIDDLPVFIGCESEATHIRISVFQRPAMLSADTLRYSCEGEPVSDYALSGEAGSEIRFFDATDGLVNTSDLPVLGGTIPVNGKFQASLASLGYSSTPKDSTYLFKVVQVKGETDVSPGFTGTDFMGCVSDTITLRLVVNPVPGKINLTDSLPYCDIQGDGSSLRIAFEAKGDTYSVYDSQDTTFSRLLRSLDSTAAFMTFDLQSGATNDSSILLTQTTGITGEFEGCESAPVNVTVSPLPALERFRNNTSLIKVDQACSEGLKVSVDVDSEAGLSRENFTVNWTRPSPQEGYTYEADSATVGSLNFQATVTDKRTQCTSAISENILVGESPEPVLIFQGVTDGNLSYGFRDLNVDSDDIRSISLQITNGNNSSVVEKTTTGSKVITGFVNQRFLEPPGRYQAKMITLTNSGCADSLQRNLTIIPKVIIENDTTITFDQQDNSSWFTDVEWENRSSFENSWKLEPPGIAEEINQDPAGDTSVFWVTNPNGSYFEDEVSFVYSPAFDISKISRPAIKFNFYVDFVNAGDGVVLQWSNDDGSTWNVVGDFLESENEGTGRSWYTHASITASPGTIDFNRRRVGWASDSGTDNWGLAVHSLTGEGIDFSKPVRFRFALASREGDKFEGNSVAEGFAFDNFTLFSRRRATLVETFSSMLFPNRKIQEAGEALEQSLNDRDSLGNSVVWANYFTDLWNTATVLDPIHASESEAPNARLAYYGVRSVPTAILAGTATRVSLNERNANTGSLNSLGLSKRDIEAATLDDFLFQAVIDTLSIDDQKLHFKTTFTSLVDRKDLSLDTLSELSLRVLVIQSEVAVRNVRINLNQTLLTDEDTIKNVVRAILPSPTGMRITPQLDSGSVISMEDTWMVKNILAEKSDAVELNVVAFIQNDITKEILQVVSEKIQYTAGVVTSIPEIKGIDFVIYPNPADREFTLQIEGSRSKNKRWVLTDMAGRGIANGPIKNGTDKTIVDVTDIKRGIYLIRIMDDQKSGLTKKIFIQ